MQDDSTDRRALSGNPAVLVLAAAVVVGAAVGGLALARQSGPSGDQILTDAEERYESAETVAGAATVTVENDTAERTYEVAFTVTDDNETRLSVDGPRREVVVGSNGSAAWVHSERTGLTRVYSADEVEARLDAHREGAANGDGSTLAEAWPEDASKSPADARTLAWDWTRENTTAEVVGTETLAGTEAYVVEVRPRDAERDGTVTLWVATDDSRVLQQRVAGEEGTVTVRFTETRFDVNVADSTFQPPSAETPDVGTVGSFDALAAATSLDLPRIGTGDYEFVGGSTVAYGDATTVVQQYDGPGEVVVVTTTAESVPGVAGGTGDADGASTAGDASAADSADVETETVGGVTVTVAETDRGVAVSWTAGDVQHAVVSDQSRETVLELIESVIRGVTP